MAMPPRKRLGQLLTELKIIDEHQLQSALGHQKQWGGKLGVILLQKGFCNEEQMVSALSQHLSMPLVRLSEVKVDPAAVKKVSRSVAERLHVFAYEVTGAGRSEVITVAMSDPTDLSAVDQLAFHTGKRIKPMLAGDSDVIAAIQQHYGPSLTPAAGVQPVPAGARPFLEGAQAGGGRPTPVSPLSAVPAAAAPTPAYSKRAEPPRPTPAVVQAVPAPVAAVEGNGALAPAEPVELPTEDLPADAPVEGLEPIAAHTQGEESVQGAEDVAGEGVASDAVVGLEAANPPLDAGGGAPDAASAEAPPLEAELPVDAILGTAQTEAEAQGQASDAPDAWSDIADPLAAPGGEEGAPAAEEGAPAADDAGPESAWAAAAAEVEAAAEEAAPEEGASLLESPSEAEAVEEVAIESEGWVEEVPPAAEEPQADPAAGQDVPFEMEPDGSVEGDFSTRTARQGWISRVAAGAGAEEGQADELSAAPGEEGAPPAQDYAEEVAPDAAYAEAPPVADAAQDEYGNVELAGEEQPAESEEGWVGVAEDQPQEAGWAEEAISYTPLSPADLRTLDALGLDPSDAAAAQRMLACLVRVLNRRQAIDVEELAAEIRESRLAGEAAAQAQPDEQAAADAPVADELGAAEEASTNGQES
jgi:Type II secretion system (T2SS), protein E, N-terminal domain